MRALRKKALSRALTVETACYQENSEKLVVEAIEATKHRLLELSTAGDRKSLEKRTRLSLWIECLEKTGRCEN